MKKVIAFCLVSIFFITMNIQSVSAMESQQEKEIVDLLSEVKYSDDLIDTVHENGNVLKAIGLYFQMIDGKDMSEDEMIMGLAELFVKAGWTEWVPVVRIKHLKGNIYLISIGYAFGTQSSSLYVFYDSSYKKIATGENGLINIIDYRLADDELGVIFDRVPGSTAVEPDFALLRKEKGKWSVCWTPEGKKEWLAMDGEIKFFGKDLSPIEVRGSSFALALPETKSEKNQVFPEGHVGVHRFFVGLWEKQGCAYVRRTKLPANASFYDKLWEMTEPSTYSTVYEFLRRLRVGEDRKAAELASISIVEKAKKLGLSQSRDLEGDLIYYAWAIPSGQVEPPEEELKTFFGSISQEEEVVFFYRKIIRLKERGLVQEDVGTQYGAVLKALMPAKMERTHWRIVDIERLRHNMIGSRDCFP
jgi:hypothetical protein